MYQVHSHVRSKGDVKSDAPCKKLRILATTLWGVRWWPVARQNFCPYPIYPHFPVAVQISQTIILDGLYYNNLPIVFILNLFSSWICMKYLPLDVKQPTIKQSIIVSYGVFRCVFSLSPEIHCQHPITKQVKSINLGCLYAYSNYVWKWSLLEKDNKYYFI